MISKQKNFSDILKTLPHFKKDSIILISHVNNLTTLESNLIKSVCQKNQVVTFYVKLNLLKKLSKNELFNNLLKGPTQLYFFNNTSDILPFIEDPLVKKKIIPLAIFWNDSFFSYKFFLNAIKNLNSTDTVLSSQKNLISELNRPILTLQSTIKTPLINFIQFLTLYKNKKF